MLTLTRQQRIKGSVLFFWILIIGSYWWITDQYGLSPGAKVQLLADVFVADIYGPLLFIVIFSLQPLVFFPSFLLGITAGILYGPVWGVIYAFLGGNGAASVCYTVGRFFGPQAFASKEQFGVVHQQMNRLRTNTFETILICHLLVIIPFDIVNYAAGFLRMTWRPFALATAIGMIPGIFVFVFFGDSLGSIDQLMSGRPDIDWRMLTVSGLMILVGIGLSRLVKRYRVDIPEHKMKG
ncbi:MAG: TVP38/TMEM64 family protein [Chloroflexota bacterium]